jgi:cob(I)alamin adenosyltransferase
MAIYTRTGDFGETSLFGGKRVLKCDDLVDFYGSIDELNSSIGLITSMALVVEVQEFLREIQRDLFTIGSFFTGGTDDLHHIEKRVEEMEVRIDKMDNTLSPIHQFVLPGGTPLASFTHISRSLARRVERRAVFMYKNDSAYGEIHKDQMKKIIMYLNRLSDFLFVLARFVNKEENVMEIAWNGEKRKKDSR